MINAMLVLQSEVSRTIQHVSLILTSLLDCQLFILLLYNNGLCCWSLLFCIQSSKWFTHSSLVMFVDDLSSISGFGSDHR